MTMLLTPVRLELTTLAFLGPLSDQLSYRGLFEEDPKKVLSSEDGKDEK